jgi:hypothetical protein
MRGAVAGCSPGQLAALIQQRVRHGYCWQWPTPLPSRRGPALRKIDCHVSSAHAPRATCHVPRQNFFTIELALKVGRPDESSCECWYGYRGARSQPQKRKPK